MTKNPIKWYIKRRGEYDFDSARAHYETEHSGVEMDLTIDEWTTKLGWTRRKVRCTAHTEYQTHEYTSDFLADVPHLSSTIGRQKGGETISETTSPTRAEQIQHTVRVVKSQVRGNAPRYFETEQAFREALRESNDSEDPEHWLVA